MYILAIILVVILGLYFFMDKKIHVQRELVINRKIGEAWEVMGNQYAQVHLWSTNFKESKPAGVSKFPGLDYSERITITDRGETIQVLDSFDAATHTLSYHISKGAPSIAKHASAVWSLLSDGVSTTKVVLEFSMETKGVIGFLMTPMIKIGMGKSAIEIAEDLKYYVENSIPHPRKKAQLESRK